MSNETRVVTIGNFDGAYLGHQHVLQAERGDDELAVITLWPHLLSMLAPEHTPRLLDDLPIRIGLFKQARTREARAVRFGKKVAAMSPVGFAERFVVPLAPWVVVVEENFRLGHRASGDVRILGELAAGCFEVRILRLSAVNARITCSTLIQEALDHGDVWLASQHLGRDFRFSGVAVAGDQRGRKLGFLTANLVVLTELAVPVDGAYAG